MTDTFTNDELTAIYQSVGKLTINWGLVEFAVDALAIVIYHEIGGRRIQDQLPIQFERKIRFLRSCFSQIALLSEFSTEASTLLKQVKTLALTRNQLTHSYLSALNREKALMTFVGLKLNESKTLHTQVNVDISIRDLLEASDELGTLAKGFVELAGQLLTEFSGKRFDVSSPTG